MSQVCEWLASYSKLQTDFRSIAIHQDMNDTKRKKLEQAGWAVGSASDFLELSESEEVIVDIKLALASCPHQK